MKLKDSKQAVRELRTRLGDTQQAFAARTGLAISTVVRYELSRAPKGQALAMFERLAFDNDHLDLAAAFRLASWTDAGLFVPEAEGALIPREERRSMQIPPGFEPAFFAFIDVLTMAEYTKERAKVLAALKDIITRYKTALEPYLHKGYPDEG